VKEWDNLQAHVPVDLAKKVDLLAKASGLSKSRYLGELVKQAVDKGIVFKLTVHEASADSFAKAS
jgi:hypothetical protein